MPAVRDYELTPRTNDAKEANHDDEEDDEVPTDSQSVTATTLFQNKDSDVYNVTSQMSSHEALPSKPLHLQSVLQWSQQEASLQCPVDVLHHLHTQSVRQWR